MVRGQRRRNVGATEVSSGVVGVVVTYWPSRRKFLPAIVDAYRSQTVPVDHLIVWNNHPEPLAPIDGAVVINSTVNLSSRAKYAAAMTVPSPWYLLTDDDVYLRPRVVEHMLTWGEALAGTDRRLAFAYQGMRMASNYVSRSEDVNGVNLTDHAVPVDTFVGITQFLSVAAISRMFEIETGLRTAALFEGEDLLIAMGNDAYVVPTDQDGDGGFCWFGEESQVESMKGEVGYHECRDEFAYRCWRALGGGDFGDGTPGADAPSRELIDGYKAMLRERYAGV